MAYSPEQLQAIAATQGGGYQLYNMAQSGAVDMATLQAALGADAVSQWLASNNLQAPGAPAPTPTPTQPKPLTPTPAPSPSGSFGQGPLFNTGTPGGVTQNTDYTRYPTPIPTSPDYEEAANQQGQANLDAAKSTIALSNPNSVNPFGSQTYTIGPDGRPVQNQNLSPQMQSLFDALSGTLGKVSQNIDQQTGKPISSYDFQDVLNPEDVSLKPITQDITAGGINTVADALRAREQPRFDRNRQKVEADLLARGFNPGTEAWNERMDDLNRGENDFNLGLVDKAGQEQSRLFDLQSRARYQDQGESESVFNSQLAKRQSQIQEQALARTLPLQEYNSILSALRGMNPSYQPYTGATVDANPIFAATNAKGLFDLGRYGTSISGELGTRGIDKAADWGRTIAQGLFDIGGAYASTGG